MGDNSKSSGQSQDQTRNHFQYVAKVILYVDYRCTCNLWRK